VDAIRELLVTEPVEEKLAGRGISSAEAQQLIDNRYVIAANTGRRRRSQRKLDARRLVVGQTNGGRTLTLVIEQTMDPTTWLAVTGWDATPAERRMLGDR
jgi:uncharacterized DUF497 family protein